jgi:hypothetical protein
VYADALYGDVPDAERRALWGSHARGHRFDRVSLAQGPTAQKRCAVGCYASQLVALAARGHSDLDARIDEESRGDSATGRGPS